MTVTVAAAGVDTWSPCWYLDPESPAARWLESRATVQVARGRVLPESYADHRIGWNSGAGMLFAEGHPTPGGLASPGLLPGALEQLVGEMREAGIPVPEGRTADVWDGPPTTTGSRREGFAGVRRLDLTADIETGSTSVGLGILAGVAAVLRDAPGTAEVFYGRRGEIETVYLRGHAGKRVLGRWYDKGVESGTRPRGELIRPEDQRRFVKGTRRDVTELHAEYVRGRFQARFYPLWKASKGVTVAGVTVLAEKIGEAVQAGEITPGQAKSLAGYMLTEGVVPYPARTRRRHRREARQLGLVLADGVLQEVEIDLHEVLEAVMDSDEWTKVPRG